MSFVCLDGVQEGDRSPKVGEIVPAVSSKIKGEQRSHTPSPCVSERLLCRLQGLCGCGNAALLRRQEKGTAGG